MHTLADWLHYLENLHPIGIDMGLTRIQSVVDRMGVKPLCPVITVAGTNGKGSCCAMLTQIFSAAGYQVGTFTSPHLLRYNERIAINGRPVSDALIVQAFAQIEAARTQVPAISLSYFEFNALAAVLVFNAQAVDVMVLEVGLGGRLDAVNVFDTDCAIVASIDYDHQAYLGSTLEAIAYEKAGVFRKNKPAICGQSDVPQTLIQHAEQLGANLALIGRDFGYYQTDSHTQQWDFWAADYRRHGLPLPALRGQFQLQNAACVLMALQQLHDILPVSMNAIRAGLVQVELVGRFQVLAGRPVVVLDVAHNPHAAKALAHNLQKMGFFSQTYAVFAMLADKESETVIRLVQNEVQAWHVATLEGERGQNAVVLAGQLQQAGVAASSICTFDSVEAAFLQAYQQAKEGDRIVVFGSFFTVSAVLEVIERTRAFTGQEA